MLDTARDASAGARLWLETGGGELCQGGGGVHY